MAPLLNPNGTMSQNQKLSIQYQIIKQEQMLKKKKSKQLYVGKECPAIQ